MIIAILLIWYLGRYPHIDTGALQKSLQKLPLFYSGIVFIALYVVITFFVFFSKDVFWLTGALSFGVIYSTLFICIAEVINAFILFYLARHLGRAYIEKSLSQKYRHLDERLGNINFFWLFIFRVAPLIPYRFLDLAVGLTKVHFRRYILAVILGSPIKMFWIQYILSGLGKSIFDNPYALVGYFLNNKSLLMFSFMYFVLFILVALKIRPKD